MQRSVRKREGCVEGWEGAAVGLLREGEEGLYTGAQITEEFLNLRVPQIMRLLARKVQKYKELQERIQARRDE